MSSVPQVADFLTQILGEEADRLARATGCIKRQRKFSGASLAQTLVISWLANPQASLESLASTARSCQVVVSDSGMDKRFSREAADFLHRLLQAATSKLVEVAPAEIPLFSSFAAVILEDSSTVTLPDELAEVWQGCGGKQRHISSGVKLHVRLDLLRGGMQGPLLTESRRPDNCSPHAWEELPQGGLLIADLGYFHLRRFQQMDQAGRFFLSRLKGRVRLFSLDGLAWQVEPWLPRGVNEIAETQVLLGAAQRLAVRLIAVRVPAEVAEERRVHLRQEASKKDQAVSPEQLRLADWTIVVTNVPAGRLDRNQVLILLRARWQIELVFRLWKKGAGIATSSSQKPWRRLCELYAKLLASLIEHWIMLQGCWPDPHRSLEKAAAVIRLRAYQLLDGLRGKRPLPEVLADIAEALLSGCRRTTRRKHPSASQVWLDGLEWKLKWV